MEQVLLTLYIQVIAGIYASDSPWSEAASLVIDSANITDNIKQLHASDTPFANYVKSQVIARRLQS